MAQTKAQRSAAAKKAARTRKRNAAAKKGSKSRSRKRQNQFFFLRLITMNLKCKNCGKEFELFSSEFCCKECVDDYYMRGHPK